MDIKILLTYKPYEMMLGSEDEDIQISLPFLDRAYWIRDDNGFDSGQLYNPYWLQKEFKKIIQNGEWGYNEGFRINNQVQNNPYKKELLTLIIDANNYNLSNLFQFINTDNQIPADTITFYDIYSWPDGDANQIYYYLNDMSGASSALMQATPFPMIFGKVVQSDYAKWANVHWLFKKYMESVIRFHFGPLNTNKLFEANPESLLTRFNYFYSEPMNENDSDPNLAGMAKWFNKNVIPVYGKPYFYANPNTYELWPIFPNFDKNPSTGRYRRFANYNPTQSQAYFWDYMDQLKTKYFPLHKIDYSWWYGKPQEKASNF